MTGSVRQQLLWLGFLGLLLTLLIGGFGYWGITRTTGAMNRMGISAEAMRYHLTADMMRDALRADVLAAMMATESSDPAKKREVLEDLSEHASRFREQLKKIGALSLDGEIQATAARLISDLDAYVNSGEELARMILAGRLEAVARLDGFIAAFKKLEGEMRKLSDLLEKDMKESHDASNSATFISKVSIISISLIGFLILGMVFLWIGSSIAFALKQVSAVATQVAAGNLTVRNDVDRADEIGHLAATFNRMTEHLRQLVFEIRDGALQVASTSQELSASSQQMGGNSEETKRLAHTVSSASTQTNDNVRNVATAAEEMSATLKEISLNVAKATQITSQAVQVASTTTQTISKLGESSAEIDEVVKVITAIAQQTNLLALNAAIEAARAGEAGKGFAVVANEVKDLAKKTAKATEEIGQKIATIQADTKGAVSAIEEISNVIAQTNEIATTIAGALEEQTATTNEISRSASEAATGTGEVTRSIVGVASAAKNTADGATAILSASQKLSTMSRNLMGLISKFQIDAAQMEVSRTQLVSKDRTEGTEGWLESLEKNVGQG